MNRIPTRFTPGLVAASVLLLLVRPAVGQATLFHDRATFEAALSAGAFTVDDFESYALGPISLGDRRGDFLYSFDPSITQPAIVSDGAGGQALGGSPFDVFVGGDSVTLTYSPLTGPAIALLAIGLDVAYAPAFEDIPANVYRLGIEDGSAAGQFVGNLDGLDGAGGTFFLGLIADPSAAFTMFRFYSVQPDPNFLVPAYQGDNLTYQAIPEPGGLAVFVVGSGLVLLRLRRRHS
jgi:hypothetical protein